ncbi:MCE family protein [Rhodococcus sp. AD45-ID]|uniref:MCE family protein n=1 Tax=Rhodococcus globerulus TaxID=33008 RepID=A0ABU4BV24_RHOGO|nr:MULTISPECIES: MCE family protein [Rhodococcus]KJF20517.1 virulence factor Mce family protein [Rhodococcus sp. AD45]MDV6268035.1 MCE family protein [Rhodococcus globerulus]PSR41569.1 MCE family protein [Rhodococcus sp. AD45-ID]PVX64403.1 virulence factor Mce-like protein [Rhodococcus globerulus]QXW04314.1 MCE family protein [Rhodococcus globerulus]
MIEAPSVLRRRVLGIVFFVVLALFLTFTIGAFNKSFTDVVKVDLLSDSVGNALPPNADVKVRGMLVGEVRSASTTDGVVTSVLAIEPDKAELIPSDATARLLPKTLFGERYVSLIIPEGTTAPPLSAGTVLHQDKSGNAIEVGEVLDGLLPLLQAIPPQDLANTLGSLAQGLTGRGAELGLTVDRLEEIFREVNTELPAVQEDLRKFADFSQTYSEAAPDLVNALDTLRTTGNTVVEKQNQVNTLLASLTATSSTTAAFLETNAQSIITLSADSREALQLLAQYSPTFGCTFKGFAETTPKAAKILSADAPDPGVRANIQIVNPKGRYIPNQDEPRLVDNRGPVCYDNVTEPGRPFPQYPGGSYGDGSYQVPSRNGGPETMEFLQAPEGSGPQMFSTNTTGPVQQAGYAGSQLEEDTLKVIYGQANGVAPENVPSWTTMVSAPAFTGAEVSFQ